MKFNGAGIGSFLRAKGTGIEAELRPKGAGIWRNPMSRDAVTGVDQSCEGEKNECRN